MRHVRTERIRPISGGPLAIAMDAAQEELRAPRASSGDKRHPTVRVAQRTLDREMRRWIDFVTKTNHCHSQ